MSEGDQPMVGQCPESFSNSVVLLAASVATGCTDNSPGRTFTCKSTSPFTARSKIWAKTTKQTLSPRRGITYYLLTPDLNGRIEFLLSEYQVGASTGDLRYTHAGEECGLVLQGRLELQIGDATYILKPGDSIRFDCSVPHRLTNVGKTVLKCVWAVSPPSF